MEPKAALTEPPRIGRRVLSADIDQRKESKATTCSDGGKGLLGTEVPPSSLGLTHRDEKYIYLSLSRLVGIKSSPLFPCAVAI